MEILNLNSKIDINGYLRLAIPTSLPPGDIELVLVINQKDEKKDTRKKYDFSDLVGKLSWEGDAVSVQRSLRDEW